MISQTLRDARQFEEEQERRIDPGSRPAFHLSARVGWLNDPNGFCFREGLYHLFYQYHPYDSHWGPMHWGHAVSEDLLHWRYLPAAIAPDMPYDHDGCFSGSALTLPDGRHLLMYTGVARQMVDGCVRTLQTQNLAVGDGRNYEKHPKNPVLTAADLPEGGSPFDFRDPKLWQAPDGSYRVVLANDRPDDGGQILLYRSEDLVRWQLVRVLAENRGRIGRMWECPDFFELDGAHVLMFSAMDMMPRDFEYHNGNGSLYFLGRFDPETETFFPEVDHAVDYGIDFYAPQTLLTPDGRRVMIGWMQNWDTCNLRTKSVPWFGQMTLPRELSVRNGRLYQQPVRELTALRRNPVVFEHVTVENASVQLPGVCGRTIDLEIEIEPEGELFSKFSIHFARDATRHTGVSFRPKESVLKIDRKYSGSRRAIIHQRRAKVAHGGGRLRLRLILDRCSAEVFVGDGEQVLTATVYTDLEADGISFHADGAACFTVRKYDLDV